MAWEAAPSNISSSRTPLPLPKDDVTTACTVVRLSLCTHALLLLQCISSSITKFSAATSTYTLGAIIGDQSHWQQWQLLKKQDVQALDQTVHFGCKSKCFLSCIPDPLPSSHIVLPTPCKVHRQDPLCMHSQTQEIFTSSLKNTEHRKLSQMQTHGIPSPI